MMQLDPTIITRNQWEIIQISVNGQEIPNVYEVQLPSLETGCFVLKSIFMGKDHIIWATGAIKIIAYPKLSPIAGFFDEVARKFGENHGESK